jgi:hypothetical protein
VTEGPIQHTRTLTVLVLCVMAASAVAAAAGIFIHDGPGPFEYQSVRGQTVTLHGYGPYKHMSADVAVQGIGHDYVTLFLAVPMLGVGLVLTRAGSLRARIFLAGVLGYFLVTYLFYLTMGMYNALFLVYAFLLGTSFFGFALTMRGLDPESLKSRFRKNAATGFSGGFLIFNTFSIAALWLGVVVPPLIDGSLYPVELQHYTTLIVQGLDLGLLLPMSFISGCLLIKRHAMGYLLGTVYLVFLSLLMAALTAKIIAMGLTGVSVIPAVFIIPATWLVTILSATLMLHAVQDKTAPDNTNGATAGRM